MADSAPATGAHRRATPAGREATTGQPEALDLGAAVLPVLAKAYWKQALGALAVILVIWRLVAR